MKGKIAHLALRSQSDSLYVQVFDTWVQSTDFQMLVTLNLDVSVESGAFKKLTKLAEEGTFKSLDFLSLSPTIVEFYGSQ